jgi:ferritin
MIKTPILAALNKQVQLEQSNAHAYEAMALYFDGINLHGLEAFMVQQAAEERTHAGKFIAHIRDRGGPAEFLSIPAPKSIFESPLEAARSVRDQERATTEAIHRLYELARKENDYPLEILLHWFITEQVEEERWSGELLALMEQFHAHPGQLFMLDHQWGKRVKAS